MAVKKCCIENCKSCSTRKEDKGVTYHKFPKDGISRNKWKFITHYTNTNKDLPVYVCSRHFCKGDFLKNKDSKYILKPDAVPSIFPWTIDSTSMDKSQLEKSWRAITNNDENIFLSGSNESEAENLEAIKKFIEDQEKEIQALENEEHVKEALEKQTDIEEQVKETAEKKIDIEEQVKETAEKKTDIEEQVKETAEKKIDVVKQVKKTADKKTDIEKQVEDNAEKKTDIEEQVKETAEMKTDIEEQVKETTENKTDFEEHVKATAEMKTDIEKQVKETAEKKTDIEKQVKDSVEKKTDIEEHVKETAEMKTNIEEQVKETTENKTDFEEHVKATAETKTDIEDQVKETAEKKTDIEEHVNKTTEKKTDIDEQLKETTENTSDIKEYGKDNYQTQSNIEEQVKQIQSNESSIEEKEKGTHQEKLDIDNQETDIHIKSLDNIFLQSVDPVDYVNKEDTINEQMGVTSSVMDCILSESESNIAGNISEINANDATEQILSNENNDQKIMSPNDKGNSHSMFLSIGSKVEVKDFGEEWYPAEIAEVDYEEMEVLVRYEMEYKKSDEWITVSSPRLRPYTGALPKPRVTENPDPPNETAPPTREKSILKTLLAPTETHEEPREDIVKIEEKPKLVYDVGERCLARWRDNRRFVATINKDLGNGKYEIIFDDGFFWTCGISRLHKMKAGSLTVDTSFQSATSGSPSPLDVSAAGPSSGPISPIHTIIQPFHTHLFDPTRDYLGSKSERREKKRKLNVKELFNIGQKRFKTQKTEKEKAATLPVQMKPAVGKKNLNPKMPWVVLKKEKLELPDAVASIIGTKEDEEIKHKSASDEVENQEKTRPGIKTDVNTEEIPDNMDKSADNDFEKTRNIKEVEDMEVDSIEPISCVVNPNDKTLDDEEEVKSEGDPVLEEEVALENFEKQDIEKHEAVLDKIKEAITKLEGGISEIENVHSPKVQRDLTPKLEALTPKSKHFTPKLEHFNPQSEALTPKFELGLTPSLERALTPQLERANTPESEVESNIKLTTPEITEDVKPQDLKDVLAEVAASINISDSNIDEECPSAENVVVDKSKVRKSKRDPSKIKKSKKLRLLQEKKVKKQVEKVKNELELMKRQFEEMKKQMLVQSQEFAQAQDNAPLPESFLLPGEWCCKWVNGQPVGKVSEIEGSAQPGQDNKPVLPRRSVEVCDKRLPPGWTKHMVRRSAGNSAGKWNVVLVSPEEHENRRFHTKIEMRNFLELCNDPTLKEYEQALTDFGAHLKISRRMGWIVNTPDGIAEGPETILPADATCQVSPLIKRKNPKLKRKEESGAMKPKKRRLMLKDRTRRPIKIKLQRGLRNYNSQLVESESGSEVHTELASNTFEPPLEDGYVYVGSLKVQIIENLLRCPAEGCLKNFRTKTLLQMHIKHYHRELIKMMGATPKVLDLAYARTMPNEADVPQTDKKVIKVKFNKPPRREELKMSAYDMENSMDGFQTTSVQSDDCPISHSIPRIPRSQDSPRLHRALVPKPVRRPRVLLPVRRLEPEQAIPDSIIDDDFENEMIEPMVEVPMLEQPLDFETAISTHTVTKPLEKKKKGDKKKSFASFSKTVSEDEEWFAMNSDELDTRSSFPRSGSPDSKVDGKMAPMSSESNDDQKDPNLYAYNESGERIKIVHMRREEIINCHCGIREEDGLMVQCELCLCWQHALCHNIQRECEVPEKYTCSICLNPRRGRRSKRFIHDQDRLYEGLLPGARPCDALRREHELAGNLLRLQDALHALRVKYYVAHKKDHPKLYLWASEWEKAEVTYTQEKLNSDYSDLNIMINGMDKENLPLRPDIDDEETHSIPDEHPDNDRVSQRDNQLGSQCLLSGLLSSPGGASFDLPISTSDLERLATSVQEPAEWQREAAPAPDSVSAPCPQPEAAIENDACRARLLRHIQRCQAMIDTRLDSIEAQVAELESQDPSFSEHQETAEFYPRTKQTIQMLMRDLETMEELGVIT